MPSSWISLPAAHRALRPAAHRALRPAAHRALLPAAHPAAAGEEGSAIVEFIFLTVLLMIPLAYLVLTVGALQGGSFAVVGAADQAARVYVLQTDEATGYAAAQQAVALAVADMGFDPAQAVLTVDCAGGCQTPGTIVRVQVRLEVRLPVVGGVAGLDLSAATVEASSTQQVGRFR